MLAAPEHDSKYIYTIQCMSLPGLLDSTTKSASVLNFKGDLTCQFANDLTVPLTNDIYYFSGRQHK